MTSMMQMLYFKKVGFYINLGRSLKNANKYEQALKAFVKAEIAYDKAI